MPSIHRPSARPLLPPGQMPSPRDRSALMPNDSLARDPTQHDAVVAAGVALSFEFRAASCGVHVVRVHRRDAGTKLYCSVLFDNEREFVDWIDADPLRHAHALVFQQACRCFGDLLAQEDHHDTVRA